LTLTDPLPLAQALIRCPSVTPSDQGTQAILIGALEALGFGITQLPFGKTANFWAQIGEGAPHFCFAGHTDVVPPGLSDWNHGPFSADVVDGTLFGRGACDMKGAVAAFVAAVARHLGAGKRYGTISLLITGDEEGEAIDGTVRVVEWLRDRKIVPDFCLVGEPTNAERLGETIKIGRRGSLNANIVVHGTQGHVAYPQRADNPVHRLIRILTNLTESPLDAGNEWFEPSSLQVTTIDVGNSVTNVIPASARARLNIRFNDHHRGADLAEWVRSVVASHAEKFDLDVAVSGEAFLTEPSRAVTVLRNSIASVTGLRPRLDTGGGTSDARFITRLCPVAEFGLVGATMHKTDECVPVTDLNNLTLIYEAVLAEFMA
jgi:succinyl-diaminopimelate desuccinylase